MTAPVPIHVACAECALAEVFTPSSEQGWVRQVGGWLRAEIDSRRCGAPLEVDTMPFAGAIMKTALEEAFEKSDAILEAVDQGDAEAELVAARIRRGTAMDW